MNLPAVCLALATQPGLGSHRIVHLNGLDSLCDPVGAILIYAGNNPLDLQYYQNLSTDLLYKSFFKTFSALDLTIDDVEWFFRLVDNQLSKDLTPKKRRDIVINKLLVKEKYEQRRTEAV